MKYYILLFIILSIELECKAQWVLQNSGTTNTLKSVYFTDEQTGYACGEQGTLLKTIDGGNQWVLQDAGTDNSLNSVYFLNADTGYISGNDGLILKTTDAGLSWQLLNTGTTSSLFAIRFIDAFRGFVSVSDFKLGKTVDGGSGWTYFTTPASGRISIIDTNTLFQVGWDMSIFKTNDGGVSWDINVWHPFYGSLNDVCFTSPATGIVVGGSWAQGYSYSVINSTHDGGATWHGWNQINSAWLNAACFADSSHAYAVGPDGIIFYSSDAGIQWNKQVSVTSFDLLSVNFPSLETGYAVGEAGTIIKTANGGVGIEDFKDRSGCNWLSPNPCHDKVTIRLPFASENAVLTLTDTRGREVYRVNIYEDGQMIDLGMLKSGYYFVKVKAGNKIYTTVMVKE
jgi:photosystem II stability/assembly factor-like uncharacterized protein